MQGSGKSYQEEFKPSKSRMEGQGRVWKRKIKSTFQAKEAAFAKVWKRKFEEF